MTLATSTIHRLLVPVIYWVLFFTTKLSAQPIDKIIPDRKLTWEDYRGEIENNTDFWAKTHWAVTYKYSSKFSSRSDTAKLVFDVVLTLKPISWVRPEKKSARLLKHEQVHFDLAKICAAEFKKKAASSTFFKHNYRLRVDAVFKEILNKYKAMQELYDRETNHMMNKGEQERWEKKIAAMLVEAGVE
ncbi:MAG: DUF922 domain-containing protein [Bacteroidota bacterium]